MNPILSKYAHLLVNYCLDIKKGDRLYIKSTTLAEPLIREVYREALKAGALPVVDLEFREKGKIFMEEAEGDQLRFVSPLYKQAMEEYEAYLFIRAPFNLKEDGKADPEKLKITNEVNAPISKRYFERTATRELKRSLCQYPTIAAAQNAGLSLEDYEKFVFGACNLFEDDPVQKWLDVRKFQQQIVDVLNTREKVQYKG
ncbi:MAG: aminopeptidase, partial [Saprospiraceae bacterium]